MNLGMKDFFIGVVHLFVIFLPGAFVLLSIFYAVQIAPIGFENPATDLNIDKTGRTLLFLGLSYFIGHIVSLFGSKLEDWSSIRLRKNERGEKHAALRRVAYSICTEKIGKDLVRWNTVRRWSANLVRKDNDILRPDIEFKDADRRFFRNIRLVLLFPLAIAVWQSFARPSSDWIPIVSVAGILLLLGLSHRRYINQDAKFTELVFESLIAINSDKQFGRKWNGLTVTHAGGVVFRKRSKATEYLIVNSTGKETEWVLPKGHIESHETAEEAAIREVGEEAGVEAKVLTFLDFNHFSLAKKKDKKKNKKKNKMNICVANYLMRDSGASRTGEPDRQPQWHTYDAAKGKLTFADTKVVLKLANELLNPHASRKSLRKAEPGGDK